MLIRILKENTDRPRFYHFCFVVASPKPAKAPKATEGEAESAGDGWTDQQGGGSDAYDTGGRELTIGSVMESEITALGRRVTGPVGGRP